MDWLFEWLPPRSRAFAEKKIGKSTATSLVVLGLLAVASWTFEDWVVNVPLQHFLSGWRTLVRTPVGFVGLVFFAIVLGLIVLAFIETSPVARAFKDRLARRSEPFELLRANNARLAEEHRHFKWERNWGAPPPGIQKLEARDAERAATELARLDSTLGDLNTAIERLWNSLAEKWIQAGDRNPDFWCGKYVYDSVYAPTRRSLALVRNPGDEDHREAFKVFFENYRALRQWFQRAAAFQQRPIVSYAGYAAWHTADQEFFRRLNEFPNLPYMAEMREIVRSAKQDGYPEGLPTSPSDTGSNARPSSTSET